MTHMVNIVVCRGRLLDNRSRADLFIQEVDFPIESQARVAEAVTEAVLDLVEGDVDQVHLCRSSLSWRQLK